MNNHYEAEKERILEAVRNIMNHFPQYIDECHLGWPICWKHQTVMSQVIKKDSNTYYQCMEFDNGKCCFHKTFGI